MLVALPMAVAIALSPFAIIPAIVLLLTPRPREAAGAFLAGWVLGRHFHALYDRVMTVPRGRTAAARADTETATWVSRSNASSW